MPELDRKATSVFAGKVVRKDLVRKVVLLQMEWERRTARISYNLERRFSHVQEDPQAIHRPGEGRHPSAPSPRTCPRLGSVRPARHPPHDVLPLAEGVLRERPCRV